MSKFSSKIENELNDKNSNYIELSLEKNDLSCSGNKIIHDSLCSSNEENIPENIINYASNSCSIGGSNELFNSLMNTKNNKNKEFSLLYLINTFGKSYSNESSEKNKKIIDLPKISKNLFSKPQAKSSSSKHLDSISFQNNLPIKKCYSKGGHMNNFFSSIYEKQMSSGKLMDITVNGQKSFKKKDAFFNSGNKINKYKISPFVQENYKFGTLFNNNNVINVGNEKNENNVNSNCENKFNTSLLKTTFGNECNNNNSEEIINNCD